jgi:hypothetical protein
MLNWIVKDFHRRLKEDSQALEDTRRDLLVLVEKLEIVKKDLSDSNESSAALSEEILQLKSVVTELHNELMESQQQRLIDQAHFADDYKKLRTRVLRTLDKQSEILGNSLFALRGARYEVAEEFVERSLEAIERDLSRFRDEG